MIMQSTLHPKSIKILIPAYNCAPFIDECLTSVCNQTCLNWTALLADDASSDDTVMRAKPYLEDGRFSLRVNRKREFLMGNIFSAFLHMNIEPEDVVLIVHGDDKLLPGALDRIWEYHRKGFDFVYTDHMTGDNTPPIGRPVIPSIPIRQQLWCFSHVRSFKGYLFLGMDDGDFRDDRGRYFRAAGDLSLLFPMAEMVGSSKIAYIPEKLYFYRDHPDCNHYILRGEQLDNNWLLRSRKPRALQTQYFDFYEDIHDFNKSRLRDLGREYRERYPKPFSVCLEHRISSPNTETWRAYHNLWIEEGVFLRGIVTDGNGMGP